MDGFLELLLTSLGEIISNWNYKDPRKRTWIMTGFFTLVALFTEAFLIYTTVDFYRSRNAAGTIVFAVIAAAVLVAALFVIIRGHRNHWDRY